MWKITKVNVSRNICYTGKERDSTERIYVIFWVLAHTGKLWIFRLKGKEGPIFQKQPWKFVFQSSVTGLKEQLSVKIIMEEGRKKRKYLTYCKSYNCKRIFILLYKKKKQTLNKTTQPQNQMLSNFYCSLSYRKKALVTLLTVSSSIDTPYEEHTSVTYIFVSQQCLRDGYIKVLSDARMGSNNPLLKQTPVSEIIWKYLHNSF